MYWGGVAMVRRNIKILSVITSPFLMVFLLSGFLAACSPLVAGGSQTGEPNVTPTLANRDDLSYLINENPAGIDASKLPITPTDKLHLKGTTPSVDTSNYRLSVTGQVINERSLSYDDILSYPSTTETALLICSGLFADNAEWTGVSMREILADAKMKEGVSWVTFRAFDGYEMSFSLDTIAKDDILLAYKVNGDTLPSAHGYPVRLVIPGKYGFYWVRWINNIEVG